MWKWNRFMTVLSPALSAQCGDGMDLWEFCLHNVEMKWIYDSFISTYGDEMVLSQFWLHLWRWNRFMAVLSPVFTPQCGDEMDLWQFCLHRWRWNRVMTVLSPQCGEEMDLWEFCLQFCLHMWRWHGFMRVLSPQVEIKWIWQFCLQFCLHNVEMK